MWWNKLGLEQHNRNIATPIMPKIHFVLALDLSASNYKIKWLVLVQLIEYKEKNLVAINRE